MCKTKGFLLTAGLVFAMVFTFSCSSDDGEKEVGGSSPSGGGEQSSPSDGGGSSSSVKSGGSSSSIGDSGNQFNPNINYTSFTDSRDGKTYKKVTIGTQTWMAENLNYNASGSKCYDNDPANCGTYGRLYDWNTAMNNSASSDAVPSGVQGVCPSGWHLPSDGEWNALMTAVGGVSNAGGKLQAIVARGTDDYGFSALLGGNCSLLSGNCNVVGSLGYWWSSTEYIDGAYRRSMGNFKGVDKDVSKSTSMFSVRCLKD